MHISNRRMINRIRHHLYVWKEWFKSLITYPEFKPHEADYNRYWHTRKLNRTSLNDFQKERAELALRYIEKGSKLVDVGSGNGAVLTYINEKKPMERLMGIDISQDALEMARENGVETFLINVADRDSRSSIPSADYIFLFEVLEHMAQSEEVLQWAVSHARRGVLFSVPNTGFLFHRLRLLFGRFPLQWRTHPSEHVRFWTLGDMRWWLDQQAYMYTLHAYQGIPILKSVWPALGAQGLFVYISKQKQL